jgi:hypothetical protein
MNKWILNPTEIDFDAGTAMPLTWSVGYPYTVENTAYDADGKVLFYIQNMTVYDANGVGVGSLPIGTSSVTGYSYPSILHEIAIVPVPGSCNRFYVIYCLNRVFVGNALKHAIVTINPDGTISVSTDTQVLAQNSGNTGAIAVTTALSTDGVRKLYWVSGHGGIFEYDITASGITLSNVEAGYDPLDPEGKTYHAIEAEISKDRQHLIWVEKDGAYYRAINAMEGEVSIFKLDLTMWGIEFNADEDGFYVSTETDNQGTITGGIYHYTSFSSNAPVLVNNTSDYTRTLIEKGKDGNFYAVNYNGILGSFVGNGPAAAAYGGLLVYSSNFNSCLGGLDYYKLPDQIDGEDYNYFYGVAAINITGMNINGTPLVDAVPPPPPAFYNCNAINWTATWTGQPASWTIDIFSVDPATGNQLFGSPYLNFSTSGTGNIPSPVDLRSIGAPGIPDLFANYLGQTFALRVTATNECGNSTDFMLCYFRVLGPPAQANINLQVNPGNGTPCPASHNIASPCPASIYSASINMGNSQGDITYYSLKIDEVDCSAGAVISNIYTGPQVSVTGASQLTAIGLNDLTINGSTGYFVNKCCRCYRVEATIGNACGSSTDYSYIKFTVNCNCLWSGGGGEERSDARQQSSHVGVRVAPNPMTDFIRFLPDETGALPAVRALTVFNALGAVVIRLDSPDLSRPLAAERLPAGMYSYLLEAEAGPLSGKFVKQ